eukprot:CAMPEP_0173413830 /NCGR_PEP_ID=MMETSP1356-20130122/82972_1 /TAXON_ID=77927 ORGANISM="Hemiselmis virescens, Strain PCC157" /NCGR_SAMPLE_ID=MMETSP1356 /ASSEMBLY_ACC=CAM_ASM_000847 /LENGTH=61 /DNA_ID=CAMNT_0014375921 /DNA_START=100 /DNA_END=282 /DNA_ORIENTATION=+
MSAYFDITSPGAVTCPCIPVRSPVSSVYSIPWGSASRESEARGGAGVGGAGVATGADGVGG